jgi:hypothetical protein
MFLNCVCRALGSNPNDADALFVILQIQMAQKFDPIEQVKVHVYSIYIILTWNVKFHQLMFT